MSADARLVVFVLVVVHVFAFVVGTASAFVDGWKQPWCSYRLAFGAVYLVVGAFAVIAAAAVWANL